MDQHPRPYRKIPDGVLFDIDGTLVDSNELHVEAWDHVFRTAGFTISRNAIHGQIGKGGDKLVPALLPDLEKSRQAELAERHGDIFKARFIGHVKPFRYACDLMKRVHLDRAKVILASSAGREEIDFYVDLLKARKIVDLTVSKDDVDESKPAPDIFAAAIEKSGMSPSDAIVIGDSPYDVLAASKLEIPALGLLSGGFTEVALRRAGAQSVFDDVADVLDNYAAAVRVR